MATLAAQILRSRPAPMATVLTYKPKTGVVVSAGKMDKTIKVRIATQKWNQRIRKNFTEYESFLVSDPNSSCLTGDVVSILPKGYRSSPQVRHIVHSIVAPMGPPIDARPPIPSIREFEAERQWKMQKVLDKHAEAGNEEAIQERQRRAQRDKKLGVRRVPAARSPYSHIRFHKMKKGDWLCGAPTCIQQNHGNSEDRRENHICVACGSHRQEAAFVVETEDGYTKKMAKEKMVEVIQSQKKPWLEKQLKEMMVTALEMRDETAVESIKSQQSALATPPADALPKTEGAVAEEAATEATKISSPIAKTKTNAPPKKGRDRTASKQNETAAQEPGTKLDKGSPANESSQQSFELKAIDQDEFLQELEKIAKELPEARVQADEPAEKIEEQRGAIEEVAHKEPVVQEFVPQEPVIRDEVSRQAVATEDAGREQLNRGDLLDEKVPSEPKQAESSQAAAGEQDKKTGGWLGGYFGR